jgi:hypothetical protein
VKPLITSRRHHLLVVAAPGLVDVALLFSIFSDAITPLCIAFMLGPLSAVSAKRGRMLMRFSSCGRT